ncbi:outer membrane protein, OMP85 family [Hyphomonas neptunium ATCC 15444]|uniref:Outer membrane protein assembly factor BamA n=2 Tax=Hyphomonas TaxID=85 RepID=Q0C1B3_HYPNA|nr:MULTISPECIES: outer membrane protein assembly factor BamA [Hyphomonas]ABI76114.1 outer membrane protein, OMP85 family [Hyphomonas neptunium ATCC 15444]KCZ95107.1 OMP85 family outer membrane protein [Hyphomonas hirschiana VP5]
MLKFLAATILATSALGLGVSGFGLTASAQEDALYGGTIRTILVEGNQRIEARTVQSYLLVEPGDAFDPDRIDLSLKTLFATNLFADVSIDRRGNDLVIQVVENPIINRVIFEGNRALKDDKLREEIQAAPRGIFTAARVQSDVQRIMELYRRSGRFAAKVEPQYKPLEQNRVDLIFEVTEGPVTGVRSINFIGNKAYSDSRLRSEIVTKQSRLWRFFSSNDNYDSNRLEYDREQLREFYQNNGYYDFRVTSAVAELAPDQKDFYITYTVDEGRQYDFGAIKVETALEKLDADVLRAVVPITEGDLFRGNQIEATIDSLTYAAGVAGYAFVDVRPQISVNEETGRIDITFAIDEGPRVYIDRINIVGNTQTLDRVIRRELRLSEGDAFNRILLDRSRNRVRALGFFEDVEVVETPSEQPDRTIVDIKVKEQSTGELSFAAGFSSVDAYLFDLSASQRNLRGRGQSVVARTSLSSRQQIVDLRFTEPRFLDRNLSAGVDLFATRQDFEEYTGFTSETIGGGVRMAFPLTDRMQMGVRYRLQTDDVSIADQNIVIDSNGMLVRTRTQIAGQDTPNDLSDDIYRLPEPGDEGPGEAVVDICNPGYVLRNTICRSERSDISSIVGYDFFWDQTNDPISPTRGFNLRFSQDLAGLGGDVKYIRTETGASFYRGIWRDVVASANFSGGLVVPLDEEQGVRINNRFFRGGSTFRGFDVAGLGPREILRLIDPATGELLGTQRLNSLGGNAYYQGTFELTVPNFVPEEYGIKSALFLDVGSLGLLEDVDKGSTVILEDGGPFGYPGVTAIRTTKDAAALRASAGISVFWDSPFGPIRFDFSHILRKEDYDRTETFRFSTSTRF